MASRTRAILVVCLMTLAASAWCDNGLPEYRTTGSAGLPSFRVASKGGLPDYRR